MPKMEKVYLHNPSSEEISLISISATTAHFHASFFQNRVSDIYASWKMYWKTRLPMLCHRGHLSWFLLVFAVEGQPQVFSKTRLKFMREKTGLIQTQTCTKILLFTASEVFGVDSRIEWRIFPGVKTHNDLWPPGTSVFSDSWLC